VTLTHDRMAEYLAVLQGLHAMLQRLEAKLDRLLLLVEEDPLLAEGVDLLPLVEALPDPEPTPAPKRRRTRMKGTIALTPEEQASLHAVPDDAEPAF
jgi:hypothetical protein